jgi:hypothetical protein
MMPVMMDFTFALRAFAKFRSAQLAAQQPARTQMRQLLWLLHQARSTKIGKEYHFSSIRSLEDYQKTVPLRRYEDFWKQYWEPVFPILNDVTWPGQIPFFSWTSGTTSGKRKYIPYSKEMGNSYNKVGTDLLVHHVNNRPLSRVLGGKSFMLGGTTKMEELAPGVRLGEISGISAVRLPTWAEPFFFPPNELSGIHNWIERTQKIAEASVHQDIRILGGMPSWLLIFLEKFKDRFPDDEGIIGKLYPNLEMFVHGGVKFDPYLKQYKRLLQGTHAELREVYPASEAFMAVGDRGYGEGLRLGLDAGIFYEFVPVEELDKPNPKRFWIGNVERDVNYAIVLTTCAGVWSYIIGDTVRFVDTETPRILVTGRTTYSMSAFGEHLIYEEVEKGVAAAADSVNASVVDYSMGVNVTAQAGDLGSHLYVVEFNKNIDSPELLKCFKETLDAKLLELNDDYADHRAPGCGLNAPVVRAVRSGTFAEWMASRGKLGDQHKVPRIMNDRELFVSLVNFCDQHNRVLAVG